MASQVPPTTDERHNLVEYLNAQRETFRYIAHGLTDEQARLRPTAGSLSIGGLVKHLAACERNWAGIIRQEGSNQEGWEDAFTMREDETLAALLDDLDAAGRETADTIADLTMETPVPVPHDVPWFPKDVDNWPVRWVLAHLIEEYARHAGHADIVRESIDGKTMFELQAMADGWHEQYLQMTGQAATQD